MADKRKKNENRITYLSVIKETLNISGIFRVLKASLVIFLALFIIDYYNIISRVIEHISMTVLLVSIIVLILFVGTLFAEWHILSAIKNKSVNLIDDALLVTIIVSFMLLICSLFGFSSFIMLKVVCFIISITLFLNRCYIRYKVYNKSEKEKNKLLDLKDVYENHINYIDGNKILLSENDVEYDLLNRELIINHLYMSIISSMSDKSFVISLEGEWGSGKTTILNGVKKLLKNYKSEKNKSEEIVVIDDFEPWTYGNQEALLAAMFDKILVHSGIKYNSYILRNIKRNITKAVINSNVAGNLLYDILKGDKSPDDSIERLKQMISSYIKSESKTFVFFIDNLDRIEDDNIVFLFKLISVIFNFPRMIYVLSFGRDRIDKVFSETKNIDPRFTEKIINQIIEVPPIEKYKKYNLYEICIKNILEKYDYKCLNDSLFRDIMQYIVDSTDNIRVFKRMINTVFSSIFEREISINKDELLAIKLIYFYNPKAYYFIYKHSRFFVSEGFVDKRDIISGFGILKDKFNKEATTIYDDFFNNIIGKNNTCVELLSKIFPYVSQYQQNKKIDKYSVLRKCNSNSICDGRFFDLYYSFSSNMFSEMHKIIDKYLRGMRDIDDILIAKEYTKDMIISPNYEEQKELINQLQDQIMIPFSKINNFYVAYSLFELIYCISDAIESANLNPRYRTEFIIAYLICKCDEKEIDDFIKLIEKNITLYG